MVFLWCIHINEHLDKVLAEAIGDLRFPFFRDSRQSNILNMPIKTNVWVSDFQLHVQVIKRGYFSSAILMSNLKISVVEIQYKECKKMNSMINIMTVFIITA